MRGHCIGLRGRHCYIEFSVHWQHVTMIIGSSFSWSLLIRWTIWTITLLNPSSLSEIILLTCMLEVDGGWIKVSLNHILNHVCLPRPHVIIQFNPASLKSLMELLFVQYTIWEIDTIPPFPRSHIEAKDFGFFGSTSQIPSLSTVVECYRGVFSISKLNDVR